MRVNVVAAGTPGPGHALSTYIIDGVLAVDAGGLGWAGPPDELARVTDVLLTHSHIDHVAGLPVFLDTVYRLGPRPPAVYAPPDTLAALRTDVFNDRLMPDFVTMSETMPAFLTLHPVGPGEPFPVGRYTVTAFALDHTVPTVAYLVDDGTDAIAVVTDTAPVPHVIDAICAHPRLRTLYLEASFPDAEVDLARVSKHLTAADHRALAARVPAGVTVVAVHVKPRFAADVLRDLSPSGMTNAPPMPRQ